MCAPFEAQQNLCILFFFSGFFWGDWQGAPVARHWQHNKSMGLVT
jgi:hypothetical protein